MRYGLIVIALAALLLLGCVAGTRNVSPETGPTLGPEITSASFSTLGPWHHLWGSNSEMFRVEWQDGTAPFTISLDMGGGTTRNVPAGTPAESPFENWFTFMNPFSGHTETFEFTVVVTDSIGRAGTFTGTYGVYPSEISRPEIVNVSYVDQVLVVTVSNVDGDDVIVTVTEPAGLIVDETSKVLLGGNGDVEFYWSAVNCITGASGMTEIKSENTQEAIDTDTATITIAPIAIPAGALAAVPLYPVATPDDVVTVVVISGGFSNPFHYMNGVGVTVESGATYADGTFNVGAPGGDLLTADGLWADMSPLPDSFLVPHDFLLIQENDIGGGRVRIDFNVTPIGGGNHTGGGALFNFGLEFDHAGTYTLGFEEFHDLKRTYYSDSDATEYFWDDISNNYTDVPNSIEVLES